jgi:Na+-transporting methylmalonyl-CoA/oxaloacetate decarboxylase gamma subunit
MTYYIPLTILIAVVALVSVVLDRRWQARRAAETSESSEDTEASLGVTSRITDRFQGVRQRIGGKKREKLTKVFQAWAAEHLTSEEELRDWIANLSEEGAQSLTEQLATFCSDLNFELSWLVEGQLDPDPDLEQVAENVVTDYCSACWRAALAQDDLNAFQAFQAFENDPTSKKHREFAQELYSKLVEAELVSSPSLAEVFLASDDKRLKQAAKAMRQSAEMDRKAFNAALKTVVASLSTASDSEAIDEVEPQETVDEVGEPEPAAAT